MMARPRSSGTGWLPLLAVLLPWAVGMVILALGHWRTGSVVIGAGLVLGAVLRLVLSRQRIGLLRVRDRGFDIGWYTLLGAAIIVLANVVPGGGT